MWGCLCSVAEVPFHVPAVALPGLSLGRNPMRKRLNTVQLPKVLKTKPEPRYSIELFKFLLSQVFWITAVDQVLIFSLTITRSMDSPSRLGTAIQSIFRRLPTEPMAALMASSAHPGAEPIPLLNGSNLFYSVVWPILLMLYKHMLNNGVLYIPLGNIFLRG